jgi:hypothetical protein
MPATLSPEDLELEHLKLLAELPAKKGTREEPELLRKLDEVLRLRLQNKKSARH